MQQPTMFETRRAGADTLALRSYVPLPGLGVLPVNAFLLQAQEPVLVDTGLAAVRGAFMRELRRLIDPAELRWIFLSHIDQDHVGNLQAVLDEAPHARIVTNYLGMGKLSLIAAPLDRVYLLNPGQSLDVGDRRLVALRPPTYDAPETMGFFDTRTRELFSSDSFGALLDTPAETLLEVTPRALRDGMVTWATIDAPWVHDVGATRLGAKIASLRDLQPERVIGSHLPAPALLDATLVDNLTAACGAQAFVGPDQAALERMMGIAQAA